VCVCVCVSVSVFVFVCACVERRRRELKVHVFARRLSSFSRSLSFSLSAHSTHSTQHTHTHTRTHTIPSPGPSPYHGRSAQTQRVANTTARDTLCNGNDLHRNPGTPALALASQKSLQKSCLSNPVRIQFEKVLFSLFLFVQRVKFVQFFIM
jgi:hypothetical protein